MKGVSEYKESVVHFAKDVGLEIQKITWPSRSETTKSALAVLIISGIFAIFLSFVDYVFSVVVGSILS